MDGPGKNFIPRARVPRDADHSTSILIMLPSLICGYYRSRLDETLAIVERGCLRFREVGALVENSGERPGPITPEKKAQIIAEFRAAEKHGRADLKAIAQKCGVGPSTVAVHTRELRAGRRKQWRPKSARSHLS